MNWDDMSDDQINERVAHTEHDGITLPDYCNSPDDAWPIIVEHCISIVPRRDDNLGESYAECNNGHITSWCDKKEGVLRAAMIVFLKLKEAQS